MQIPPYGHTTGGEEIALIGRGFFDGLELCFGNVIAPAHNLKVISESTLVVKAPASMDLEEGQVAVVFRHEHPKYTRANVRELLERGIMPTQHKLYTYLDDGKPFAVSYSCCL